MKFERITQNKLKLVLNQLDLVAWKINLQELAKDEEKARAVFMELMAAVEKETGFRVNNCKLMIEAMPGDAEGFVIIVTKVGEEAKPAKRKVLKVKKKDKPHKDLPLICRFDSFEDMLSFLKAGGELLAIKSALYCMQERYYLYFYDTGVNQNKIASLAGEYGNLYYSPLLLPVLKEHGTAISDGNAVETLQQYF